MKTPGYALITGAGSGLGKSLAIELAKNGFSLVLVGRTETKLKEVANECNSSDILTIEIDVSNYDDVEDCFKKANKWRDYPTMVISCAGEGVYGKVGSFKQDHIQRVLSANLIGTILISQKAAAEMANKGGIK